MPVKEAIELLDRQNEGLQAADWVVARGSESRDATSTHFAALIGEGALSALKALNFKPFCGLSQATVSKSASAVLARCAAVMHTKHLFLIQEPWLVKGHIKGLGGCGKLFKADNAERPRACIVAKGLDACLLPQFSDGDLVAVRLKLNTDDGEVRDLIVGSVYMPYDSEELPPQRNMIELVTYAKESGLELLLGCDANSHHLVWGSFDINPRGESLLDFIMSTNLQILNRGTEPTFLDSRRQEVIDITLCTRGVVDLVAGWRVSNEPSGSDHRQIRFDLVNLQKDKQWGRNPRKTNWEGFRADL
ncbi:uncharacterized protein LOC112465430, partial [Temnothorax curvispinosus]|uniref:Uncharacterized protein LOC112465430 n=1 Tax=Temnothorax curvispinosus TaxID=300111 RepID=A0A6J1R3M3_9HYME